MLTTSVLRIPAALALLFLLGTNAAEAADPTLLAEKGGFLLGNAYRCGITAERVKQESQVVHSFIMANAYSSKQAAAASGRRDSRG